MYWVQVYMPGIWLIINVNRKYKKFSMHNKLTQICWLKETLLIFSQFCWSEVHGVTGFSAQDLISLKCILELIVLFWAHSCWLAEFSSLQFWDWGPCFFVDCWPEVALSDLWSLSRFYLLLTSIFKARSGTSKLSVLQFSQTSPIASSCSGAEIGGDLLLKGSWDYIRSAKKV